MLLIISIIILLRGWCCSLVYTQEITEKSTMTNPTVAEESIPSSSQVINRLPDILFCEVVSTPNSAKNWVIIDNRVSHTKGPYQVGDEVEGVQILEIHKGLVVVSYLGVTFHIEINRFVNRTTVIPD